MKSLLKILILTLIPSIALASGGKFTVHFKKGTLDTSQHITFTGPFAANIIKLLPGQTLSVKYNTPNRDLKIRDDARLAYMKIDGRQISCRNLSAGRIINTEKDPNIQVTIELTHKGDQCTVKLNT
jgi:hypothetical protein